jgi:hypothetical protein
MFESIGEQKANTSAMSSSSALRIQIERSLEHRFPSVLTPMQRTIRDVVSTGVPEIDELLNGGLPVGAISELTGPACSGRTSIALSFLTQRTVDANVCAWVDANDALDPESAAANGLSLKKLLWVRCRNASPAISPEATFRYTARKEKPWTRLDQALRATDLLLQAGGFAAIVLDLGDAEVEHASRIPLATWFRFRQAADRTRCSLVVLGKSPYTQSSAAVVLECQLARADAVGGTVLRGFEYAVRRGRERFSPIANITRKPPVSTWSARSAWRAERRA